MIKSWISKKKKKKMLQKIKETLPVLRKWLRIVERVSIDMFVSKSSNCSPSSSLRMQVYLDLQIQARKINK